MDLMDSATEEIYFQKLQEFIQDDDKIVTISFFASNLRISIQNSRKLISKYVEDQRKLKPDELAVTYVLNGTLKDKGKGVFLVKQEDLEEKRGLFENVLFETVYSVQKSKHVDFNIVALVDMFNPTKIREKALDGSIVGKNCIKRVMRFKKLPSPSTSNIKSESALLVPKSGKDETSKSTEKHLVVPKTEQPKNKTSGGIANLFKAAAVKSSQKDSEKSPKSIKSSKPSGKQNSGLAGFLTNGSLNSSKTVSKTEFKKEEDEVNKENGSNNFGSQETVTIMEANSMEIIDVDSGNENLKHNKQINNDVKKKSIEKNKQDKKKRNKRQRDRSEETPAKKRKRIIERNDSDSDDLFEKEEDNEDIIEKSDDEPAREPSPVMEKQLVPKNKRRKAVTRNYEDEEGFIVTQTEYIYETASEDENEEPKQVKQEKKVETLKPKPKPTEKKKVIKNQATLMSFFKKV